MKEECPLIVVGAGFAGWAACQAACAKGQRPVWLSAGWGASEQSSGAADFWPWTESSPPQSEWEAQALELIREWEIFEPGDDHVVTHAGLIRPTKAVGTGVLPLKALRGKSIGVADFGRYSFSARHFADALNRESWSRESGTRFHPLDFGSLLVGKAFASVPLAAWANHFEETKTSQALSEHLERVRAASPELGAVLFEPFLPATLLHDAPVTVGETLSPPEGSFGRRVASARAKWAREQRLELLVERVVNFQEHDEFLLVSTEDQAGTVRERRCASLVLATGGLLGGGARVVERAGSDAGLELRAEPGGSPLVPPGDAHGWDPLMNAPGWIRDRGGIAHQFESSRVALAGELRGVAGGPVGTVLGAVASGATAVERLLRRF